MDEALTLEQAATFELVETAPDSQEVATYDPGQLEAEAPTAGLTLAEGAELVGDDVERSDDRPIAFHDGHPLTLKQLIDGYAVSATLQDVVGDLNARYALVEAAGKNVIAGTAGRAEFIASKLPGPPHVSLSYSHPEEFIRQRAAFDELQNVVTQVVQRSQQLAQSIANQQSASQSQLMRDAIAFEMRRFADSFPQATDPVWLKRFYGRIKDAAEACDFHESELQTVVDHRALRVLHLAAIGLEKQHSREQWLPKTPPKPRLVSSGKELTLSEALQMDFD